MMCTLDAVWIFLGARIKETQKMIRGENDGEGKGGCGKATSAAIDGPSLAAIISFAPQCGSQPQG
jgi:hypothetical protein